MPRADLLLKMVRSGASGDRGQFRRAVEALVAEERAKQHNILAGRLDEALNANEGRANHAGNGPLGQEQQLYHELTPRISLEDLVLPDVVLGQCRSLIEEHHRADLLRSYGLEPRNRVLVVGPPGNGKTSLAEAMASELMFPLLSVRYEGLIASYLGETAARLSRLFRDVRTRRCVLFLDEFDTIGKERGDAHETGEIKRVVSSLLLQMDTLPSHVVVVTATNHPELLDRAAWRRFQLRMVLPPPTRTQVEAWFAQFQTEIGMELGRSPRTIADRLHGASFSELEDFCTDVRRQTVLRMPEADVKGIVAGLLSEWQSRAAPSDRGGS